MSPREVTLRGRGLHGGRSCILHARARPGPVTLVLAGRAFALSALRPDGARRSTELAAEGLSVRTVEHACAALAALGVHEGVELTVEGDELPLLDGGAAEYLAAFSRLGVAPTAPRLAVLAPFEHVQGATRVRFEPGTSPRVEVEIDFGDARLAPRAAWAGDLEGFATKIAKARTFGFARELGELEARGLASHVTPESVVLVTDDAILFAGAPFEADEPARHKLLDLVGDLYVWGGPPLGRVAAHKPGHAATHAAVAAGLAAGALARGDGGR